MSIYYIKIYQRMLKCVLLDKKVEEMVKSTDLSLRSAY